MDEKIGESVFWDEVETSGSTGPEKAGFVR